MAYFSKNEGAKLDISLSKSNNIETLLKLIKSTKGGIKIEFFAFSLLLRIIQTCIFGLPLSREFMILNLRLKRFASKK